MRHASSRADGGGGGSSLPARCSAPDDVFVCHAAHSFQLTLILNFDKFSLFSIISAAHLATR